MTKLIDPTGRRFGRWTVVSRAPNRNHQANWFCRCDCGTERAVSANNLFMGRSASCGCAWRDNAGMKNARRRAIAEKHGLFWVDPKSIWWRRANGIARRCQDEGIKFGFASVNDCAFHLKSIAPLHCPVFGFELRSGAGAFAPDAPSADRKDPSKGYVPGNIQIISMKANVMKANATAEELHQFAQWVLRLA